MTIPEKQEHSDNKHITAPSLLECPYVAKCCALNEHHRLQHEIPIEVKNMESVVKMSWELPGYNMDDIKVSFCAGHVTVVAERRSEGLQDAKCLLSERNHGQITRTIHCMNVKEGSVKAKLGKKGLLKIKYTKDQAHGEPITIREKKSG